MANYESQFNTAIVKDNEVVKADDINYGFDSLIENISRSMQMIFDAEKDFVIGGNVRVYNKDLNLIVAPLYGVCKSTGKGFGSTEDSDPIAITPGTADRIDILEVQGTEVEYDEQQRAFSDLDTGTKTYQNIMTKKATKVNFVVKRGEDGSIAAPEVDEGFVKIAEIHVPANAEKLRSSDIYNITADVADMDNEEWTTEQDATYNIGYISDVNRRFREQHNEDGSHQASIIGINELNVGTGSDQVNANNISTSQNMTLDGEIVGAGTSIQAVLVKLCLAASNLYDSYLKNGEYQLNGEVAISSLLDEDGLTKPVKIGANGSGTAYCKIADKTIFTIQTDGRITMGEGYAATSANDLVTKSVTDTLNTNYTNLKRTVDGIIETSDQSTYANTVFSRFEYVDNVVNVATTENITLSGLQIIDGISLTGAEKVLVKDQTNKVENGLYNPTSGQWQRVADYITDEALALKYFVVMAGTSNKSKVFYCGVKTFTVDVDAIPFVEYKKLKTELYDNKSVTTAKLDDQSVTPEKIKDTSITIEKMRPENFSYDMGFVCSSAADSEEKHITIDNYPLVDGKPKTGAVFKILFMNEHTQDTTKLFIDDSSGTNLFSADIKATKGGAKIDLVNHSGKWRTSSVYSNEVWQPYTTLELIFDGTDFVIMGNPIFESYTTEDGTQSYTVYSDGLIEQYMLGSFGSVTWNMLIRYKTTNYALPNFFNGLYGSFSLTANKTENVLTITNLVSPATIYDIYVKGY